MKNEVFIIAEIGLNHNGDINLAKKLIDMAVEAGCNAVKFQKRTIDVVYTKEELEMPRESVFGNTNGDLKRGLEFGLKEYRIIDEYCKNKNIEWFVSAWDIGSVDFIEDNFNVKYHKVASACLTDLELLKRLAKTKKKLILSTGMSTIEQINNALYTIFTTEHEDNFKYKKEDIIIMHCTSTYPTSLDEINLNVIKKLKEIYEGFKIGFSGHETGILPTTLSVCVGAEIIERHITLNRAMWGSDQAASLEKEGLERLVRDVRQINTILGDGIKKVYNSELPIIKKLRKFK